MPASGSSLFPLFSSEMARRPAYTRISPYSYRARLAAISARKALVYSYSLAGTPYWGNYWGGGYWGAGYWGLGYWGYPMLFDGFGCDPFNSFFCYGWSPYGFASFSGLSSLCPPSPFLPSSFAFGYPLFWNGPFALYNIALENPLLLQPWGPVDSNSCSPGGLFPFSSFSGGTISASQATSASSSDNARYVVAPSSSSSTDTAGNATVFDAKNPAPGQPVTLVFSNGTTVQATKYWLGNGRLHYVTATGATAAVPLSKFDMSATMKANEKDGVHFLLPPASTAVTQPPKQ